MHILKIAELSRVIGIGIIIIEGKFSVVWLFFFKLWCQVLFYCHHASSAAIMPVDNMLCTCWTVYDGVCFEIVFGSRFLSSLRQYVEQHV